MTADDAFSILETIAKISGTTGRLKRMTPEGHEILDEKLAEEVESNVAYSEDFFLNRADNNIKELYLRLRGILTSLDGVVVEPKKLYIAFKVSRNFVDIEVQKHTLKLFVNMRKGTLKDPDSITDDVSDIGHWGNGDYRIFLNNADNLDAVINLIEQSYNSNK